MNNRMEKGKDIGADTGKSRESPESRASRLACELRRVDMDIYRLRRELEAAAVQREAILKELKQTAKANGLNLSDYHEDGMDADITLPRGK